MADDRAHQLILLALLAGCGGGKDAPPDVAVPPLDGVYQPTGEVIPLGDAVCDAIPTPPALPASRGLARGTRLVPRDLVDPSPGGFAIPWTIADTGTGGTCQPARDVDGQLRCLPDVDFMPGYFADAAATVPVVVAPRATQPGTVMGHYDQPPALFACGAPPSGQVIRVGARRTGGLYYDAQARLFRVPAGWSLFDREAIQTAFVALDEVRTELAGPIARRELHGVDGSRLASTELYDTAHDVAVHVLPTSRVDPTLRLLPPAVPVRARFHRDPPFVHYDQGQPTVPSGWCVIDDDLSPQPPELACDAARPRFVTDGDATRQVTPLTGTVYSCLGGERGSRPTSANLTVLGVCATLPSDAWPEVQTVTLGTRITVEAVALAGTPFRFDRGSLIDTELQAPCDPGRAADGSSRCLPRGADLLYADDACTHAVIADTGVPFGAERADDGKVTIYRAGPRRPEAQLYGRGPTCVVALERVSFEVGAVVPPSQLAPIVVRDAP